MGDTFLGWLIAFAKGDFDIRKAPQFLQTAILPYIGALLIVAGLAYMEPSYMPVFLVVTGLITAKFGVEAVKDKIIGYFN